MKILILNGSPRPNGNTAEMIAAFREAAAEYGHQIVNFDVCRMEAFLDISASRDAGYLQTMMRM